jgi:TolB-like protein/Tfp pilus assembly protein PilF
MPVPSSSQLQVGFGGFSVDVTSGEVQKDGRKISLPPMVFKILQALLERRGGVVTRAELRARLWPGDTFVEFEDSLNHAVKKLRQALGDSAENPKFIETLPRYGYRLITSEPAISERGPKLRSLAVLPLANLSGDPQQEYLADGITDALITELSRIKAIKVISRTSVMQYKSTQKPLPQIGQELRVDGVIEGAVQHLGEQLRLTVQLIDAATDAHMWAESYERSFQDVLSLQGEVAQAIARQIETELTQEESARMIHPRPVHPEAYEAYLKGMFHWYRVSIAHVDLALGYFQRALEIDPNCALAHVGISNVWMLRGDTGFVPPSDAIPRARSAALKALELDPSLAESHWVLANLIATFDWDLAAGDREYRRAIELGPNSAVAHFMYADFLISMKRTQDWQSEIKRALELDPLNPFFQCFYGWHLIYLHHCDEGIAQLDQSLLAEPGFASAHMGLWGAYACKGMYPEALDEARKFFAVLDDNEVAEVLGRGYSGSDYHKAMHAGAAALAGRAHHSFVSSVRIARLYAQAGENRKAIDWLEKACEQRASPLIHLAVARDWDPLRSDPRFKGLLQHVGLPEE